MPIRWSTAWPLGKRYNAFAEEEIEKSVKQSFHGLLFWETITPCVRFFHCRRFQPTDSSTVVAGPALAEMQLG